MAPRNFNDDRDRTVPPEEDYYGKAPVDLNFNSRESKADDEGGINPAAEYEKYYGGQSESQRNSGTPEYQRNNKSAKPYNSRQTRESYSRDDLRYSPDAAKKSSAAKSAQKGKNKKAKKKNPAPKILTGVIAVVLVLVIATTVMVESVLGKVNYDEKEDNQYVSSSELMSSSKVTNILLLGVDARADDEDEASRADSMMLISFDREHGCIKMISFFFFF